MLPLSFIESTYLLECLKYDKIEILQYLLNE